MYYRNLGLQFFFEKPESTFLQKTSKDQDDKKTLNIYLTIRGVYINYIFNIIHLIVIIHFNAQILNLITLISENYQKVTFYHRKYEVLKLRKEHHKRFILTSKP